jgi:hypothetical protein
VKNTAAGTVQFKVALEIGPQAYELAQSIDHNATVTYTFNPVFGTYNVVVYCLKASVWTKKTSKNGQTFSVTTPPYTLATISSGC